MNIFNRQQEPSDRKRSMRGQSFVEFALMMPILLLIVSGIVEAGRAFTAYLQLANAAREGARAASFTPTDTPTIEAVAKGELPSWVAGSIVAITINCALSNSDSFNACAGAYAPVSGSKVQVQISYAYTPIMPIVNAITTIIATDITTSATMQVQ